MGQADLDLIIPLVYQELRRVARTYLRSEPPGRTLQTTGLVHEAYLRLQKQEPEWMNAGQVLGVAAQQMRRILVDHARARKRLKRDGGVRVEPGYEVQSPAAWEQAADILDLDEALNELAVLDGRQARIVELRYFGGFTVEETAAMVSISPATFHREWAMAKAWLKQRLSEGDAHDT